MGFLKTVRKILVGKPRDEIYPLKFVLGEILPPQYIYVIYSHIPTYTFYIICICVYMLYIM